MGIPEIGAGSRQTFGQEAVASASCPILLGTGVLGLVTYPSNNPEPADCKKWFEARLQDGFRFHVPEIADYELRRKLLRLDSRIAITRLDRLKSVIDYLPITTAAMLKAETGRRRQIGGYSRHGIRHAIEGHGAETRAPGQPGGDGQGHREGGGRALRMTFNPSPPAGTGARCRSCWASTSTETSASHFAAPSRSPASSSS